MSTNFQSSGAPPRPAGVLQDPLPYPYVTQWNEQQQATYYANSETGETFWHPPNFGDQGGQLRGPGGIVNSASLRLGNPELKTAGASSQPGQPAPAVQNDRVRSGGEAASFYAGSGNVPQDPNARLTAAPPEEGPTSTNRAFGNESDERAQFGKALGGGGVAAMAWNLYKAYRNGKHNQQQFQPPSGSPPMFGGVGTSSLFGSGAGQSMFGEGNSNMRPPAGMYGPSGQYGHGSSHYSQHGRPQNSLVSKQSSCFTLNYNLRRATSSSLDIWFIVRPGWVNSSRTT